MNSLEMDILSYFYSSLANSDTVKSVYFVNNGVYKDSALLTNAHTNLDEYCIRRKRKSKI